MLDFMSSTVETEKETFITPAPPWVEGRPLLLLTGACEPDLAAVPGRALCCTAPASVLGRLCIPGSQG